MKVQSPIDTLVPSDAVRWSPTERADALLPLVSLEEKIAQLVGVWELVSQARLERVSAIPQPRPEPAE